jgi:hypothetical protein
MVSVILSLILAVLSFVTAVPAAMPVIGLALGANAVIKEKRKDKKNKAIFVIAPIAIIANGFVSLLFILGGFLK